MTYLLIARVFVILCCVSHFAAMAAELFLAQYLANSLAGMNLNILRILAGLDQSILNDLSAASEDIDALKPEQILDFVTGICSLIWNQGVYNAFIAGGLLLSFRMDPKSAWQVRVYLAACICAAGLFGGFTVSEKLFVQAALGGITWLLLLKARPAEAECRG